MSSVAGFALTCSPNVVMSTFPSGIVPNKSDIKVKTFNEYATQIIVPHVLKQLEVVDRVDVVWDVYKDDSLKAGTRNNRGNGTPICITNNTCIPVNWKTFLHVS